jgi:YD repeat-containing protein
MRLRNGTVAQFLGCGQGTGNCALYALRDADGHTTSFLRDPSGLLRRIDTGRQHIDLAYDAKDRIVRATDGSHQVEYRYDTGGRLTSAASDGVTRSYVYDTADRVITVRQPTRVVENRYDSASRLVGQTVRQPGQPDYVESFTYVLDGDSVVEATEAVEGGVLTRYRFNKQHRITMETYERAGHRPITATFDLTFGDFARSVTVWCTKDGRRVTADAANPGDFEQTAANLIKDHCD